MGEGFDEGLEGGKRYVVCICGIKVVEACCYYDLGAFQLRYSEPMLRCSLISPAQPGIRH